MQKILKPQFRIVFIYIIVGFLWIFLSDFFIDILLFESTYSITFAQNIKGWIFIAVTGFLLFLLVKRDFDALTKANNEVIESYDQTIYGWINIMDLRHQETKNHTERVTKMTLELAKRLGIKNKHELKNIEREAVLHDIGKVGIPDAILIKPGKLDEEEWAQMKMHPVIGKDILSKIKFLQPSLDIPFCHHEKWNGEGYPRGIAGKEIPIAARIFSIVDVWDALSHSRVYKSAWPEDEVLSYIQEQAGQQFDPAIVNVFLNNYSEIKGKGEVDLKYNKIEQ